MISNRPDKETQLVLFCTEEPCGSTAPELQTEQSVSATMEKSALSMIPENLMERIVDQANIETAWRKSIPKPDGSQRHLGIPNVIDRLVQQAILQVLTPIFDPGRRHDARRTALATAGEHPPGRFR